MSEDQAKAHTDGDPEGDAGGDAASRVGGDDPEALAAEVDHDGGEVVEKFVVAELTEERERRVRLDAQGASLITASTALSALAFGIGSLVASRGDYDLPRLSLWGMSVTFVAFMLAAVCGVYVGGQLHTNKVADIDVMQDWCSDPTKWFQSKNAMLREVLEPVIEYLKYLRGANQKRAFWVKVGYGLQTVALVGLSVAIGAVLADFIVPHAHGWLSILDPPG